MVELVYNFDDKSYRKCLKGELIVNVRLKHCFRPQTYIPTYIYMDTNTIIYAARAACAG